MKSTTRTAFDTMFENRECCLEFDRTTAWSTDHHWGADADGNRGISRTEIDEDYAEGILRWQSQAMHAPAFWYFATREAAQRAKDHLLRPKHAEIADVMVPDDVELEEE
jgi:hypothetical protein